MSEVKSGEVVYSLPDGANLAEEILKSIEGQIKAETIEVFLNSQGLACVLSKLSDMPREVMVVNSKRFECWLTTYSWRWFRLMCDLTGVRWITRILSTYARAKHREGTNEELVLDALSSNSTVAVVNAFMESRDGQPYKAKMAEAYTTFKKHATENGLLRLGVSRFPGAPNHLSAMIEKNREILEALGYVIENKRSNGAKLEISRRKTDGGTKSSSPSSDSNPKQADEIDNTDGADDHSTPKRITRQPFALPKSNQETSG